MNFDLSGIIQIKTPNDQFDVDPAVEVVESVVEESAEVVESVVEESAEVIESVVEEAVEVVESVVEVVESVVEESVEVVESVVEEAVEVVESVVEEAVEVVESVVEEAVEVVESVVEVVESVVEVVESVVEEAAEVVESVVEEAVEVVESVVEEAVVVESVVEEAAEVVESVVEEAAEVIESVVEVVESVIQEPAVVEEPAVIVEEPAVIVDESVESIVLEPVIEIPVQEPIKEDIINIVPKMVFIVPYRDRDAQRMIFKNHMAIILEDIPKTDYKIYFIHQKDNRTFNRGAMKNIGFLYVKSLYPNDYKTITLIFNDVDTIPLKKNLLNYQTSQGIVKHFYGYTFTLGGIVSIRAGDFERTGGFPNYWAWGYEDNAFQKRVQKSGLLLDRSQFYPILDKNIIQFNDTLERIVNRKEFDRFWDEHIYAKVNDGYPTIHNLEYTLNDDFIDVTLFKTAVEEQSQYNQIHNLKNGATPFRPHRRRGRMSMIL
jgi:hypothetical protein